MKCWGLNDRGQLGDGTTIPRFLPVNVSGLADGVVALAAGANHACALTRDGSVKCWGDNGSGQLGDGTTTQGLIPVSVIQNGIRSISAGSRHTCAVTTSGGVLCWGDNAGGQLGDGTLDNRALPARVADLDSGMASVSAGVSHTCALTTVGGLKCWGANGSGQLGDGTTTQQGIAVDVTGLAASVVEVAAGSAHTCARTSTGAIQCWGDNSVGQLGDDQAGASPVPVDTVGLSAGMIGVTSGASHSCALRTDGGIRCWGANGDGQLGDGSFLQARAPVSASGLPTFILSIAAGANHTCAIGGGGFVWCWGLDLNGQLGDDMPTERLTPVTVAALGGEPSAIATGLNHTCALLATGAVKCWGDNTYGQLGDGTRSRRLTPASAALSSATAIVAGGNHTCAATATGVKCWGQNTSGQLGVGSTADYAFPVSVTALEDALVSLAAGSYHTCGVTSAGGVACWGDNRSGQVGDTTTQDQFAPKLVHSCAGACASAAHQVTAGLYHTCMVWGSSQATCWGANGLGQLGDGTRTDRLAPRLFVPPFKSAAALAAGFDHTCAISASPRDGVECWGRNGDGQLGDGSLTDRANPVPVVGLAKATAISAGSAHTCALVPGGSVQCWGSNSSGQLGDGTRVTRSTVGGVVDLGGAATTISAGATHTCAIVPAASIKIPLRVMCWGDNSHGQLGDATAHGKPTPRLVLASRRSFSN